MRPSFWSKLTNQHNSEGWFFSGSNLEYSTSSYTNKINWFNPRQMKTYYQFSFTFDFKYAGDQVYCAFSVPYTYTKLKSHIKQLKLLADDSRKSFWG